MDAATAVFAEVGFEAASLDQVAERAGYTKGAVYANFRSKDDLLAAIIEQRISAGLQASLDAIADRSLVELIDLLDPAQPARPASQPDTRWLMLVVESWLHAMRRPDVRTVLAGQYERARGLSDELIAAKFADAGVEPPMPTRDIAILMEALGIGIGIQAALDPAAVSMRLQGETLWRLLAEAVPATEAVPASGTAGDQPAASASGKAPSSAVPSGRDGGPAGE